ncbi:CPBP family glutamic-type intramembrane protease [Lentzea sp. DG1S-22]|uniref:CPBP family glutamic-type intramembrane protease n=1 Tax=Lentzea sp. DG1S-22 TaxID=3108822 RepID=UPI002E7A3ABE|nr:CPBP family glutamic-type intramembrane protease [Lentzea sp. DG1S-22]WVH82432.1 CPBP family glutamic-type intramembrane protease [Lentzea sp. DG1S-22]
MPITKDRRVSARDHIARPDRPNKGSRAGKLRSNQISREFEPSAGTAFWPFTRLRPAAGVPRTRAFLLAVVCCAYALAFGWPIYLAVSRLVEPRSGLSADGSDLWRGIFFNGVAIVAALVVLVTFRRAGAPLTAGRLTSAGVRPAFYAAGIWVLSQMLATPISALLDAGPGSHDFPAIAVQADRGLQLAHWITWAVAAGVSEEIIANAAVIRACELWNVPTWLMYVLAVVARLSFHAYYGLAVIEKVPWALLSAWAYRQGRLLWPLITIHVVHDMLITVQASAGVPQLSTVLALVNVALVVFVIVCFVTRRRRTHRADDSG